MPYRNSFTTIHMTQEDPPKSQGALLIHYVVVSIITCFVTSRTDQTHDNESLRAGEACDHGGLLSRPGHQVEGSTR